jgi:hypothetical protein
VGSNSGGISTNSADGDGARDMGDHGMDGSRSL